MQPSRRCALTFDAHARRLIECLGLKAHFALMTNGQNSDFVSGNHEPIKRDVSGRAVRNDHFAQLAFEAVAH